MPSWCCAPFLGSVPAYYREVYEAVCSRTDERVQVEVFHRLLQRTDLSKEVLGQVRGSHSPVGGKNILRLWQPKDGTFPKIKWTLLNSAPAYIYINLLWFWLKIKTLSMIWTKM